MTFKPELLNLYELLTNRLFEIPDYQRTYSWQKKQRKDLFEDILKIDKKNQEHFMATIVCLKKEKKQLGGNRFEVLDIVDGQQRITTLITLLKALSQKLLNGTDEEKAIGEDLSKLLVKERDETVILLQTNHDSSNIYSKYLRNSLKPVSDDLKTIADKNLADAFNQCEKFLEYFQSKNRLKALYEILMEKLKFILHILEDEGIVYTVFEVLNSRGLEVEWLDKSKSVLLGQIYESATDDVARVQHMKELHTIWSNIYRVIGIDEINSDEIIQFAATLREEELIAEPFSPQESIEAFKAYCSSGNSFAKVVEISNLLLQVAERLLALKKCKSLYAISRYKHVRLLKVAIDLRIDFTDIEQEELTDVWEKVSFKIYGIGRKDSRSGKGPFTKLSQCIAQKKQVVNSRLIAFPFTDIKKSIHDLGNNLVDSAEIYTSLSNKDLYEKIDWAEELKYFMYKYERFLYMKKGYEFPNSVWEQIISSNSKESIEHIYPIVPNANWPSFPNLNIHRLGNLAIIPLPLNIEARNNSFLLKKQIYQKEARLLSLQEIIYDEADKLKSERESWGIAEIEKREILLIEWAKSYWN